LRRTFPIAHVCAARRPPQYITYYGLWDSDELYDLKNDPDEMKNLPYDPHHKTPGRWKTSSTV
jgi:hypothetical protein